VRSVLEQVGINNVLTKVIGSKNTLNVVRATLNALLQLETPLQSASKRGISLNQLFGGSPAASSKLQEPMDSVDSEVQEQAINAVNVDAEN